MFIIPRSLNHKCKILHTLSIHIFLSFIKQMLEVLACKHLITKTFYQTSHKKLTLILLHRMALENLASGSKSNNNNSLTWSQGQMIPPKHIKRYPMATRHTQTTSENIRSSFLKTGSTQTRINIAKKIARAVGTVIKNATWSSISWKQRKIKGS